MDQALIKIDDTTVLTVTDNILFHANGIKTAWNKSVAAFIETGLLLLQAKKEMSGSGRWLKLFDPTVGALPFGVDTAERLMRIAKNKVLTNSANWRNLPPSIRTLDVLSKDTKRLEKWLTDGTITADTELKQAESLVSPKKPAKAKAVKKDTDDSDKTAANAANEVQQGVQHLYTLACDAKADWMNVDTDMVHDLIEEMESRLEQSKATAAEAKAWAAS